MASRKRLITRGKASGSTARRNNEIESSENEINHNLSVSSRRSRRIRKRTRPKKEGSLKTNLKKLKRKLKRIGTR